MTDRVLHSEMEFRSLDEEARSASYVASTEKAVSVGWSSPEVLRMTGARLQRFRKNPVVLDTHNRFDLGSVIGRADVKVQGRELHATIHYANTQRGDLAWSLVRDGFVRAVSIGYSVNPQRVTRLRDGETDGEGDGLVTGPANVVREWTLLEISNVPVPADEDAVRRDFFESIPVLEDNAMGQPANGNIDFTKAGLVEERGDSAGASGAVDASATPPVVKTPTAPVAAPAVEGSDERAARAEESRSRAILARAPQGSKFHEFALSLVARGVSVEEAHKALCEEAARIYKPLGTPEPVAPAPATDERGEKPLPADVTDDVLIRSFGGLTN